MSSYRTTLQEARKGLGYRWVQCSERVQPLRAPWVEDLIRTFTHAHEHAFIAWALYECVLIRSSALWLHPFTRLYLRIHTHAHTRDNPAQKAKAAFRLVQRACM